MSKKNMFWGHHQPWSQYFGTRMKNWLSFDWHRLIKIFVNYSKLRNDFLSWFGYASVCLFYFKGFATFVLCFGFSNVLASIIDSLKTLIVAMCKWRIKIMLLEHIFDTCFPQISTNRRDDFWITTLNPWLVLVKPSSFNFSS